MLDITGLIDDSANVCVFNTTTVSASFVAFSEWTKPLGSKIVYIFGMSAGGGGGGGDSGASNTNRGGGGAGGSGCIGRITLYAGMIPDTLYIQVGAGGAGGAAETAGTDGGKTVVSVRPQSSSSSFILNLPGGNNGGGSTSPSGGSGAVLVSVPSPASLVLSSLGVYVGTNGLAGGAGGSSGAVGSSKTALASSVIMGGAGGGSADALPLDYAGGNCTGAGVLPTVFGGAAGGFNGGDGVFSRKQFCSTGGSGGGSYDLGTGGRGGNGGYGSGGGGGGGGLTGGAGGNGGDGIVVIISIS